MPGRPIVYGADYSVYTRIVRLTLAEKYVDHDLVEVDIFAPGGPPGWYGELQPFGKIPAFEHDGMRMHETAAITRYVDEAFDGPALQPHDAAARARMNQAIAILDNYAYRTLVWDIYVERVSKPREGGVSDEARIAAALPRARICLDALAALKGGDPWLAGDALSLADIHAAPMLDYALKAPEGRTILADTTALHEWWSALADRLGIANDFVKSTPGSGST